MSVAAGNFADFLDFFARKSRFFLEHSEAKLPTFGRRPEPGNCQFNRSALLAGIRHRYAVRVYILGPKRMARALTLGWQKSVLCYAR